MTITPKQPLTRHTVPRLAAQVHEAWKKDRKLVLDLSQVSEIDSSGAALVASLKRHAENTGKLLHIVGVTRPVESTLALFPYVSEVTGPKRMPGWLERLGSRTSLGTGVAGEFLVLFADVVWFSVAGLFRRRGIRWQRVVYEMSSMGSQAVGVVGLISFLVGGTMALQSALQLRQFGANIFVADLIGISMTRELGPLMAAIVVAGRSGSAVAAELATMVITEEVDAVRTMGLNPTRFLVVPKFVAITLTQPILTMMANILGIFGGFLVAITYLEVGPSSFLSRLEQALFLKDLLTGLFKSVVFAQLIVTISALCGLRTRGGADEVGRSTTLSVVASIFAVIVADAICSLVFYFGD